MVMEEFQVFEISSPLYFIGKSYQVASFQQAELQACLQKSLDEEVYTPFDDLTECVYSDSPSCLIIASARCYFGMLMKAKVPIPHGYEQIVVDTPFIARCYASGEYNEIEMLDMLLSRGYRPKQMDWHINSYSLPRYFIPKADEDRKLDIYVPCIVNEKYI